jgi:hypothetical protein
MSDILSDIEALVERAAEEKVAKYKAALQEAIGILQALVGEPEFDCDTCGEKFVPIKKVVKQRRAYCSPNCAPKEEKLVIHPRISYEPEAMVKRSEVQQNRRALEKSRSKPLVDCRQCGGSTSKLYCSDECRKKYEVDNFIQPKENFNASSDMVEHGTDFKKESQTSIQRILEKRT